MNANFFPTLQNFTWNSGASTTNTDDLSTEKTVPSTQSHSIGTILIACVQCVCVAWSAVVNVVVMAAVYRSPPLHSIINYFISSLALADLMVSINIMPFAVALYLSGERGWVFGGLFCTLWTSGDILCCTASILLLTAIALDRHWAVSDPVDYREKMTERRCSVIIAFVWIFSTFLALAQILWRFIIETARDRRTCTYTIDREFRIVSSMSSFFVPLTVLIFTYINIITIARSNRNNVNQQPRGYFGSLTGHDVEERNTYSRSWNNLVTSHAETAKDIVISTTEELSSELLQKGQSKNEELDGPTRAFQQSPHCSSSLFSLEKEELRTAKLIGLVIICFVVCWLPFFTLYVLEAFCVSYKDIPVQVSLLCLWLGYAKSGLNPIVYFFFDESHRKAYKSLFLYVFSCCGGRPAHYVISFRIPPPSALLSPNTYLSKLHHVEMDAFDAAMIENNFAVDSETCLHQSNSESKTQNIIFHDKSPSSRRNFAPNIFTFGSHQNIQQQNPNSNDNSRRHDIRFVSDSTASRIIFSPVLSEHDREVTTGSPPGNFYRTSPPELGALRAQNDSIGSNSVFSSPFLGRHEEGQKSSQHFSSQINLAPHGFTNATLITLDRYCHQRVMVNEERSNVNAESNV